MNIDNQCELFIKLTAYNTPICHHVSQLSHTQVMDIRRCGMSANDNYKFKSQFVKERKTITGQSTAFNKEPWLTLDSKL